MKNFIVMFILALLPVPIFSAGILKTVPLAFNANEFILQSGTNDSLTISSYVHVTDYGEDINEPGLPLISVNVLISREFSYAGHSFESTKNILKENVNIAHNPIVVPTDGTISGYSHRADYKNAIYPTKNVEYVGSSNVDGHTMLHFIVCPFEYDVKNKTLSFMSDISLNINLQETGIKRINSATRSMTVSNLAKSIIVNSAEFDAADIQRQNVASKTTDYIIITSEALASAFYPLIKWKKTKGVKAEIITTEFIEANYSGNTIQSKIKSCIYDKYTNNNLKYVLLGGDDTVVAAMGCYGVVTGLDMEDKTIPTDLYYACFDGDFEWNADGDSIYGETTDDISLIPSVYVTRAPIRTSDDVNAFVYKTVTYEKTPNLYGWINDMLMCGSKLFGYNNHQSDAKFESDLVYEQYIESYWNGNRTRYFDTYSDYPQGADYDLNADNLQQQIHNGHIFVDVNTHGIPSSWTFEDNSYSMYDANYASILESDIPTIITTSACLTNAFDNFRDPCLSEAFIRNINSNVIAYLGCSRSGIGYRGSYHSIGPSCSYNGSFYKKLFSKVVKGNHFGEVVATSKAEFTGSCRRNGVYRWIQFGLNPIGDPEMPIFIETPVEFENVEIKHGENYVTVNTGQSDCTICVMSSDDDGASYYEVIKDTTVATFGNISSSVSVCVTKQGYIPYIKNLTYQYIQNETVSGTKDYKADVIKIGSNVTNTKANGPVTFTDGKINVKAGVIVIDSKTTINKNVEFKMSNK